MLRLGFSLCRFGVPIARGFLVARDGVELIRARIQSLRKNGFREERFVSGHDLGRAKRTSVRVRSTENKSLPLSRLAIAAAAIARVSASSESLASREPSGGRERSEKGA